MAFLNDRCARVPLTPKIVAACAPGQLHTRLMFFDLMQITPATPAPATV